LNEKVEINQKFVIGGKWWKRWVRRKQHVGGEIHNIGDKKFHMDCLYP